MPKVYQLAKDVEMGALELVEKLKPLGFNVRNHMSVLSDEEAQKVLDLIRSERGRKGRKINQEKEGHKKEKRLRKRKPRPGQRPRRKRSSSRKQKVT